MKKIIITVFAIIVVMMFWKMTITTTSEKFKDKTILRWVTDVNPTRAEQVAEFERLYPDIHVVIDPAGKGKELIQISGGKGPDLIDLSTETFQYYAKNKVLFDFNELREEDNRKTTAYNKKVF